MLPLVSSSGVSSATVHSFLDHYLMASILYLHSVTVPWWRCRWKPETLGFSSERVHPFILDTYEPLVLLVDESPDNERIFVWHVLPIDKETGGKENEHLETLQKDQSAKVIIYCILQRIPKAKSSSWNGITCSPDITIGYISIIDSCKSEYASHRDRLQRLGLLDWNANRRRCNHRRPSNSRLGNQHGSRRPFKNTLCQPISWYGNCDGSCNSIS